MSTTIDDKLVCSPSKMESAAETFANASTRNIRGHDSDGRTATVRRMWVGRENGGKPANPPPTLTPIPSPNGIFSGPLDGRSSGHGLFSPFVNALGHFAVRFPRSPYSSHTSVPKWSPVSAFGLLSYTRCAAYRLCRTRSESVSAFVGRETENVLFTGWPARQSEDLPFSNGTGWCSTVFTRLVFDNGEFPPLENVIVVDVSVFIRPRENPFEIETRQLIGSKKTK